MKRIREHARSLFDGVVGREKSLIDSKKELVKYLTGIDVDSNDHDYAQLETVLDNLPSIMENAADLLDALDDADVGYKNSYKPLDFSREVSDNISKLLP